jgi:phage tail tape-measure protein
MASDVQKYDKTRNSNAAGSGGLTGALSGFATGAGIGAAAGAAGAGIGAIPGALIGGLIGAAAVGAGSAGTSAWTDDAAQKQEIKVSEKNVASAERAEKEAAIDSQALARSAQRPGGGGGGGLPSGSSYLPAGGTTSYDTWKGRLQGGL